MCIRDSNHVPDEIREMAIHNPRVGLAGAFATHPPIEKRIEAIVKYGGGRRGTESRMPRRVPESSSSTSRKNEKFHPHPWKR